MIIFLLEYNWALLIVFIALPPLVPSTSHGVTDRPYSSYLWKVSDPHEWEKTREAHGEIQHPIAFGIGLREYRLSAMTPRRSSASYYISYRHFLAQVWSSVKLWSFSNEYKVQGHSKCAILASTWSTGPRKALFQTATTITHENGSFYQ